MPINLHIVNAQRQETDHLFDSETLVIGRSSSADLVIEDSAVSREHMRLFYRNGRLYAEDLRSANGTLLNGRVLDRVTETGPGDVIQLSDHVITLYEPETEPLERRLERNALGEQTLFLDANALLAEELVPEEVEDRHRLGRYAERLRLLNDLHGRLSGVAGRDEMIALTLEVGFTHLEPEEGTVFLRDERGELEVAATRTITEVGESFLYSQNLVREVTEKGKAALVLDARSDVRFSEAVSILSSGVRSLIAAPILDAEGIMGMIALNSRSSVRWFTEEDLAFLVSLASVIGLKCRNLETTEKLRELNRTLEQKVAERTRELARANDELRRNNDRLERTRDRLVRQEKMAALGTLTAGIAHELKNPLNFVNNFSTIAREHAEELAALIASTGIAENRRKEITDIVEDIEQTVSLVHQHGSRADSILGHMMAFANEDPGTAHATALNPLIEEFANIAFKGRLAEESGLDVALDLTLDPAIGEVTLVPRELGRVIINLIENAFEALVARAETGPPFDPELRVVTRAEGSSVSIRVHDNGEGIPPENREKVFTPFFTTRSADSDHIGLGLSIAYDLVLKAGGDLVSEPGGAHGAVFAVSLPT